MGPSSDQGSEKKASVPNEKAPHMRGRRLRSFEEISFFAPYYQDTKSSYKSGQISSRVLWWKTRGMLDNTFVPCAESLTELWKKRGCEEVCLFSLQAMDLATCFFSACHQDFGDATVTKVHCEARLGTAQYGNVSPGSRQSDGVGGERH